MPFDHLARNAASLPSARVHAHAGGGHRFDGLAVTVARTLSDAAGR